MTKTAFFHFRQIARLYLFLSDSDAEVLVHASTFSRLDYCNSLLFCIPSTLLNRLQYLQNSAASALTFTKRSAHITLILKELHWLPDSSHIKYKILLLTFKILHRLAPSYLRELIHLSVPSCTRRSIGIGLLTVSRFKFKSMGGRSFTKHYKH